MYRPSLCVWSGHPVVKCSD